MVVITALAMSCRKHIFKSQFNTIPQPGVPARDVWLANANKEIAAMLEVIYQNDSAYKEVCAAIFSDFYADERVLLKDLLFPETSDLYNSKKFQSFHISPGIFRRQFYKELNKERYPLLRTALSREADPEVVAKPSVVADNASIMGGPAPLLTGATAAAIYFPYSENFKPVIISGISGRGSMNDLARVTIVAADREADSGPGRFPSSCSFGSSVVCYTNVTVDDNYAYLKPVHIVENGAKPPAISDASPGTSTSAGSNASKVFLGWARLTRQMDKLISFTGNGGGSEIKVARVSGYLERKDGQVDNFYGDLMSLDYSRSDIRNGRWKRIYAAWDPNWVPDNKEQVFAVYEDDTKGTKTFSGSLSTNISLPGSLGKAEGSVSYKIEVQTQDEIITQRKLTRAAFFKDGLSSQGWGFMDNPADFPLGNKSWPVYDGGTIWSYTMPWRVN